MQKLVTNLVVKMLMEICKCMHTLSNCLAFKGTVLIFGSKFSVVPLSRLCFVLLLPRMHVQGVKQSVLSSLTCMIMIYDNYANMNTVFTEYRIIIVSTSNGDKKL